MVARELAPAIAMTCGVTVLQLDTDFPRVPGDVACPETYACDVELIRVAQATVGAVVSDAPADIDIAPFEDATSKAQGEIIVTSCGFLSYWQDHLAAQTNKPFISSALVALDRLSKFYAPGEVMIVTFDADRLTAAHLGPHARYTEGIVGLPEDMHLRQVITDNASLLDTDRVRAELVGLVTAQQRPTYRHILFECTNLPPYRAAISEATGLPVTDILTEIERVRPGSIEPRTGLTKTP